MMGLRNLCDKFGNCSTLLRTVTFHNVSQNGERKGLCQFEWKFGY